jgi:hypothetical protein
MKKFSVIALISLAILIVPVMAQRTALTDVLQTIPPIIVSGPNAIAGCTVLNLSPGSVVSGTTGVIQANCPNGVPAVTLAGTETPTFLLTLGWTRISLEYSSYACESGQMLFAGVFGSRVPVRLIGLDLNSGTPVTMTTLSNSTTQLLMGGYNYCLYYQNPPINGIATFTVSWSP